MEIISMAKRTWSVSCCINTRANILWQGNLIEEHGKRVKWKWFVCSGKCCSKLSQTSDVLMMSLWTHNVARIIVLILHRQPDTFCLKRKLKRFVVIAIQFEFKRFRVSAVHGGLCLIINSRKSIIALEIARHMPHNTFFVVHKSSGHKNNLWLRNFTRFEFFGGADT